MGFVPSCRLWTDRDFELSKEVLGAVTDRDIETIRISFVDQHGMLRGKTFVADSLPGLFTDGVTMTSTLLLKDTSHATVFPVWGTDAGFGHGQLVGANDFVVVPDPSTFKVLPWSPHNGWMLGELYFKDGRPLPLSSRAILRSACKRLDDLGMKLVTGLEVEFHVFKMEDPNLRHDNSGKPEDPPKTSLVAHGYQYLTEQRYDQLEPLMDLLRRHAQALHLPVRSMEAEFGPSQFEFTFEPGPPMLNADALVLFRSMVKQVCRREGFHATFMCRPNLKDIMSSGWHLHQSVVDKESGDNLFMPQKNEILSKVGTQWVAGLLSRALESSLLTTPTVNGYKRYQPYALAPDRIQWGQDNRGALLRVISSEGHPGSRIENRVGESAANPYLLIASQILSGIDGIEKDMIPPQIVEDPYNADAPRLPSNLGEALVAFRNSAFYRSTLGDEFVDYFSQIKEAEWNRYLLDLSEWEQREYFSLF